MPKHQHSISRYLKRRRQLAGYSQEQLAHALRSFDPLFAELDPQTISRWERQKVLPSLPRQVALMEFFSDDPLTLLHREQFAIGELAGTRQLEKAVRQYLSHPVLFGAHPYVAPDQGITAYRFGVDDQDPRLAHAIAAYMNRLLNTDSAWTANSVSSLLTHPAAMVFGCYQHDILIGHAVSLAIKEQIHEQLLNYQLEEQQITCEHLVSDPHSPHCRYFFSGYIGHPSLVADFYAYLLASALLNDNCLVFGGQIRTDFGLKVSEALGCQLIQKHRQLPSNQKGGVKLHGKRFDQCSCAISRKIALGRPSTIHLLRTMHDSLKDKLFKPAV